MRHDPLHDNMKRSIVDINVIIIIYKSQYDIVMLHCIITIISCYIIHQTM